MFVVCVRARTLACMRACLHACFIACCRVYVCVYVCVCVIVSECVYARVRACCVRACVSLISNMFATDYDELPDAGLAAAMAVASPFPHIALSIFRFSSSANAPALTRCLEP